MASVSFEDVLINNNESGDPQEEKRFRVKQFISSFHLRETLQEQLLQPTKQYAEHLKCVGYFYHQYPLNKSFESEYNIKVLSVPDKITFLVKGPYGYPILIPFFICPEYENRNTSIAIPGADSFALLDDGSFLVSAALQHDKQEGIISSPVLFRIKDHQAFPIQLAPQALEIFNQLGVLNLYGFFQQGNQVYFGTWGRESNARLMRGELNDLLLEKIVDVTPQDILDKGYDDLFVRGMGKDFFQIGTKLGASTQDAAVYFVEAKSGQVYTMPLNLGETELNLNYSWPGGAVRHTYTHQFYEMAANRFATITSGRLGSVLRIIDPEGNIYAKYFINLPNDHLPFAEYPWNHVLKHPTSSFLYIPDNDEVFHRFHYDPTNNTLVVLKFRLPVSGEITALTATPYGFCVALTCNHRNIILKVTEDLNCLQVYESPVEDTPFSILHVQENIVHAVSGSRFYPYGNFSRYPHYLFPRDIKESKVISVVTDSVNADLLLVNNLSQMQMMKFLYAFIEEFPCHYQALLELASLEFEAKNYQQSLSLCYRAIAEDNKSIQPHKIVAKALAATQQFDKALNAIAVYLEQTSNDQEIIQLQEYCLEEASIRQPLLQC